MASIQSFQGLRSVVTKSENALSARATRATPAFKFSVEANRKVRKVVKVVLTKNLENIGEVGSLCTVSAGFFRNSLQPQGWAKPATTQILAEIQAKEAQDAEKRAAVKAEAQMLATALKTIGKFQVKKTAGTGDDKEKLFGSVTAADIVEAVKLQTNQDLDKKTIEMGEIRTVGNHTISVKLHPEVTATFTLVVAGVRE